MELLQFILLGKFKMLKKLYMLFKIGRKLSTSGAISSIYEIYKPTFRYQNTFFQ